MKHSFLAKIHTIKVSLCQFFSCKITIAWFSLQILSQTHTLWWLTRHSIHTSKMELYSQSPLWVRIWYSRLYQVSGYFHDVSNSGEYTFPRKRDSIMKMKSKNSEVEMCWPASVMVKWGLGALLQPSGRQESPVIHSAGPATHAKAISLSLSWLYFWLSLSNENIKYSSAFWLPPVPGDTLSRTCNACTGSTLSLSWW